MTFMLTHFQVMAPFLDFVFTFYYRGNSPETLTAFRCEDYLHESNDRYALPTLGRSGIRLQHCFNLISVENSPKETEPWPLRNTALYHSFDIVKGNAFYISLKGNAIIENRVTEWTKDYSQSKPEGLSTLEGRFLATLTIHLILFQWCVEGWPDYVKWLEEKVKGHTVKAQFTGLARETEPDKVERALSKRGTGQWQAGEDHSRKISVVSGQGFHPGKLIKQFSNRFSDKKKSTNPVVPVTDDEDLDLDELFKFTELQNLSKREDEIQNALLVVEQDIWTMSEIMGRYKALMTSWDFTRHINLREHEVETARFFSKARQYVRDVETSANRLRKIASTLANAKGQFTGILQYRNMRTGEYFAHCAYMSADTMEDIALKTKQETISMHAVTILTLLFLPSTFVAVRLLLPLTPTLHLSEVPEEADFITSLAEPKPSHWCLTPSSSLQTLFSSGVMNWDDHGDGGTPRGEAIKLFLKVSIPITAVVLGLWLTWYILSRRQTGQIRRRRPWLLLREHKGATTDEKQVGLKTA